MSTKSAEDPPGIRPKRTWALRHERTSRGPRSSSSSFSSFPLCLLGLAYVETGADTHRKWSAERVLIYSHLAGFRVIIHGRIGVFTEVGTLPPLSDFVTVISL